jgi:Ca-activated chloride channel family protein
MPRRAVFVVLALLLAGLAAGARPAPAALTAEQVRRFVQEGPALLLPADQRRSLDEMSQAAASEWIEQFLARDPIPETPDNELVTGIEKRRELIEAQHLSPFDVRGQLLFLHGPPDERTKVECGETFRGVEIWRWGAEPDQKVAIVYSPAVDRHDRLWRPTDSKRVLYTDEMQYLLEQFEELRGRISGKRPDLYFCKDTKTIDKVTGVDGLFGFHRERMTDADADALLAPPADLAAWARAAAATVLPDGNPPLEPPELRLSFPGRREQRLIARFRLDLPSAQLGVVDADGGKEIRVTVSGFIDRKEGVFEEFRNRFVFPPPATGNPAVLLFDRALRPRETFVARLEVRDETTGKVAWLERGFEVPVEAVAEVEPTPAGAIQGRDLGLAKASRDSLVLMPPPQDVVFGLFRADAIVAGDRIKQVVFSLDGKPQLTRSAPPWSAELRLPDIPKEVVVRAEGLDASGHVVAADEVLLNEPQGEPRVRLLDPPRGKKVTGHVRARAAVVVPEGRRVRSVTFKLNDQVVATLEQPPWEVDLDVPAGAELAYLTVSAVYDDGTEVEDFRVLNSTDFVEEVRVDLVEVYATVTDPAGNLDDSLGQGDFQLLDNGKPQKIAKFEMVRNLPLTLGLLLDTSGSMRESLVEAKTAARDFLSQIMTPRDRCFAVGFSERPALLMPLTSDARAIETAFSDLPALGSTSLHDALVYALYQYRGVRGRRALVLLSDGDDTSSLISWDDALSYAERSGVAIYTIGLAIGRGSVAIRHKLERLATETGGRTFFISKAEELAGVYSQIDRELRSQYLLAFSPDPPAKEGERHSLEVRISKRGYKARSARGYTP